ncbi:unnamed protein product [Diamesa serratosioi]
MKLILIALLVCFIAIAFVSALPAEEGIFADSVDALSPADDSGLIKLLKVKKLLKLKKKALLVCLIAIAFVSALPAEEGVFSDSVDALNPTDDQGTIKKLLKLKKKILG